MTQGEFERRLGEAGTCWAAVVLLLERWRDQPRPNAARRSLDGYASWSGLVHEVEEHFLSGGRLDANGTLDDIDRARILAWTSRGGDPDAVDAVGWGIDVAAASTFASTWRDDLCADGETRHTLVPGQAYPVAEPPWAIADGVGRSPRPGSTTQPAIDEFPHVRVHGSDEFEVVMDFEFEEVLEPILCHLGTVATLHPNERLSEFEFGGEGKLVFPVSPRDLAEQSKRVLRLLDRALAAGARLVVLPELSTAPSIVEAIASRLDDAEQSVAVIAGSSHVTEGGVRMNRSEGVISGLPARISHTKLVPFTDDLRLRPPSKEGIDEPQRPRLTICHAREFRLCVTICKDFLDGRVAAALDRLAANVICVPAMSHKTGPFGAQAGGRVLGGQALSLIANGPISWDAALEPPHAILGAPIEGHYVTFVPGRSGVRPKAPRVELFKPILDE